MKKLILYLFIAIITPSLNAQDQSRLNQAIATLEEYAVKFPQTVKKTINCARGIESCTQSEITQTRTIVSIIGAALAVVTLGIAAGTTAKVKKWGPFKRKPESEPLILEGRGPILQSEEPIAQLPVEQPTAIAMSEEEEEEKKLAIEDLKKLMEIGEVVGEDYWDNKKVATDAFAVLKRLIHQNKVNAREKVAGQELTINDLLLRANQVYGLK